MRSLLFFCLLGLSAGLAIAHGNLAPPPPPPLYTHGYPTLYYPQTHYGFEYGSHGPNTGILKGPEETLNGNKMYGVYLIKRPDGTTQQVLYVRGPHKDVPQITRKEPRPSLFSPNGVLTRDDY